MGPLSAKSYPGRDLVRPHPPPAGRARQEIDDGRRGKGSVFEAFCPATGTAFTHSDPGRGTAHWVAFLEAVEPWLPQEVGRIYAIADNLGRHRTADALLFLLAHPRWEMVFQPSGVPQPDRAVVEDPALARPGRASLRDLGRGHRRHCASDGGLECAPSSRRLGPAASSPTPPARHRAPAKHRITCRMNYLERWSPNATARGC